MRELKVTCERCGHFVIYKGDAINGAPRPDEVLGKDICPNCQVTLKGIRKYADERAQDAYDKVIAAFMRGESGCSK